MPFAYPDRGALKQHILTRVRAGETIVAVCADPGMPCPLTVQHWARAPNDDWFGPALKEAVRVGTWMRRYAWREDQAGEFLARYGAGERLADLWRDPRLPSRATFTYWLNTQVAFGAEIRRIRQALKTTQDTDASHRLARPFDAATAERIVDAVVLGRPLHALHKSDPTLPSLKVIRRWRAQNPAFDALIKGAIPLGFKMRGARRRRPDVESDPAWAVLDAITQGQSLRQIGLTPGLPCGHTLYRWARDPEFARRLAVSRRIGFEQMMDRAEPHVGVRGQARTRERLVNKARTLLARSERGPAPRNRPQDVDVDAAPVTSRQPVKLDPNPWL